MDSESTHRFAVELDPFKLACGHNSFRVSGGSTTELPATTGVQTAHQRVGVELAKGEVEEQMRSLWLLGTVNKGFRVKYVSGVHLPSSRSDRARRKSWSIDRFGRSLG